MSAPLPPSFTRPLIAWISCLFNRLIHLLCLFTSFPLTHFPSSSSSFYLSLCSWAITQTNAVCFPLGPPFRGQIMNGFGRQLWIYSKVGCVIPSLRKKVNLRRISHADLCKFLSDFPLSSDWPALGGPMRQSSRPNLHHLTIKGEEGKKRLSRRMTWALRQSSAVFETPTSGSDESWTWRHVASRARGQMKDESTPKFRARHLKELTSTLDVPIFAL